MAKDFDNKCYCGSLCEVKYDYDDAVTLKCVKCGIFIYRKKNITYGDFLSRLKPMPISISQEIVKKLSADLSKDIDRYVFDEIVKSIKNG